MGLEKPKCRDRLRALRRQAWRASLVSRVQAGEREFHLTRVSSGPRAEPHDTASASRLATIRTSAKATPSSAPPAAPTWALARSPPACSTAREPMTARPARCQGRRFSKRRRLHHRHKPVQPAAAASCSRDDPLVPRPAELIRHRQTGKTAVAIATIHNSAASA